VKSPDVARAALERMHKTVLFRRDYRVVPQFPPTNFANGFQLDFHRRGMAEALLLHSTNSDAAVIMEKSFRYFKNIMKITNSFTEN